MIICPKVAKMGSIIGHRIDYNGVGALPGEVEIDDDHSWEKGLIKVEFVVSIVFLLVYSLTAPD